jgi:fumarate reductase flavoprotein subunit
MTSSVVDIVVVGGGGAGLAAAVAAAQNGASVLVLEALPNLRGTTSWSVGSFAAAGTRLQRRSGIQDSAEDFAEDIAKAHERAHEPSHLRHLLAREAGPTVEWLEKLGVVFVGPYPEPPNRVPRMHNVLPAGFAYLDALHDAAKRLKVDIRFGSRAVELQAVDGRIAKVSYIQDGAEKQVCARLAVVLASGDFSGSESMRQRYLPIEAASALPINPHSQGDGFDMAFKHGAVGREMDSVFGPQLRFKAPPGRPWFHRLPRWKWLRVASAAYVSRAPRALVAPLVKQLLVAHMSPSDALMGAGAVLVNARGKRVEVSSTLSSAGAKALALEPGRHGYILGSAELAAQFSAYPSFISTAPGIAYAYFKDYERGRPDLVHWANDPSALAEKLGWDAGELQAEVPELQGRCFALGPIYAMLTVTEGGLSIDSQCRVLKESGEPIPGLYAVGGVGQGGMLLKGHGLHIAWTLSSGRVAGLSAAQEFT